jgi:hypothetical protein
MDIQEDNHSPKSLRSPRPLSIRTLPLALAAALVATGCFAHAPDPNLDEQALSPVAPTLNDGLPAFFLGFFGGPEAFEKLNRADCEREPASEACMRLFQLAADRYRYGRKLEDAVGLIVHACNQNHALSCAAVELVRTVSNDSVAALIKLGCTREGSDNCHATASLLSYSCNQLRKPPACAGLADLFGRDSDFRDPVWAQQYRKRACIYGGPCLPEPPPIQDSSRAEAEAAP